MSACTYALGWFLAMWLGFRLGRWVEQHADADALADIDDAIADARRK